MNVLNINVPVAQDGRYYRPRVPDRIRRPIPPRLLTAPVRRPIFRPPPRPTGCDRPIKVKVGTDVYFCDISDVLEHLPKLRRHALGRTLDVEMCVSTRYHSDDQKMASHHLFRGLQQYRVNGLPLDLFEQARAYLSHADSNRWYAREAVRLALGLCWLMDWEHGLGCSEDVLLQIDDFVQDFVCSYPPQCPDDGANTSELLVAYSKVFRPDGRFRKQHRDTLQALWEALPRSRRAYTKAQMARQLGSRPPRSNVHDMAQALNEMGLC